jgi:hypothetical protein
MTHSKVQSQHTLTTHSKTTENLQAIEPVVQPQFKTGASHSQVNSATDIQTWWQEVGPVTSILHVIPTVIQLMLTRVKLLLWMGGTHKPTKCLHANILERDHLELIQSFYGLTKPWSDPVNERVSNIACKQTIFSSYMYLQSWDRVVTIVTGLQAGWSGDQLLAQARDFLRTVHFWAIMQWVVVNTYWCFRTIYWSHLLGLLTPEDGTDTLTQNIGKELALHTVS